MKPGSRPNLRSLKNYYMQATGAEMLRLAVCELVDAGIRVCCPVHDAVLIEAEANRLDLVVAGTQQIMGDVSELVLGEGYRVRTDADLVLYPDRYVDAGAGSLYATVMRIAQEADQEADGQSLDADMLLND